MYKDKEAIRQAMQRLRVKNEDSALSGQKEAIAICRHCGKRLALVPGKVQKQFCGDAHRKAHKRVELRGMDVPGFPVVDEPRTTDTKLPTSDNSGQAKQKALPSYNVTPEHVQALEEYQPKGVLTDLTTIEGMARQGIVILDHPVPVKPKRGKDIKCFADLPIDVQCTIDEMSIVDGLIDHTVKANRTAIAINYQHLFPDRYHSTGVAI